MELDPGEDSWVLTLDSCILTALLVALYLARACQLLKVIRSQYSDTEKTEDVTLNTTIIPPNETLTTMGNQKSLAQQKPDLDETIDMTVVEYKDRSDRLIRPKGLSQLRVLGP